jgi:hypothetical protein
MPDELCQPLLWEKLGHMPYAYENKVLINKTLIVSLVSSSVIDTRVRLCFHGSLECMRIASSMSCLSRLSTLARAASVLSAKSASAELWSITGS